MSMKESKSETLEEKCSHCTKDILDNDRCIIVALVKLKNRELVDIENDRYYHTWCWLEIAGERYDL